MHVDLVDRQTQRRMPEMPDFEVNFLLDTSTVAVRNVRCSGTCRHRSAEECASATHLVFPYRGTYLRHVGSDQSVADANHVLLFNAGERYQVSHPVTGGDAIDAKGRSSQRFAMEVVVQNGEQVRRATAGGRDIYAITAPLVVEAVERIVEGRHRTLGVASAGATFDACDFLAALSPGYLQID